MRRTDICLLGRGAKNRRFDHLAKRFTNVLSATIVPNTSAASAEVRVTYPTCLCTDLGCGGEEESSEPEPRLLSGGRGADGRRSTPEAERVAGVPSAASTRADTSAASGQCWEQNVQIYLLVIKVFLFLIICYTQPLYIGTYKVDWIFLLDYRK